MRVALSARREELLQRVAARVEEAGGEAWPCITDMAVPGPIEALVAGATERFGRIDVLIANAGVGYSGSMLTVTDEQMVRTIAVNLLGVLRCARAVLPGMVARRSGHILTVSSVAAGIALPRAAVYA